MVETGTIAVQVKLADGKSATVVGILKNDGDDVVLRTEKPGVELHFNYVPLLEYLFSVEKERKKIKLKRM
ncbi:MAG: hypothetical protein V1820_06290 [archaeon]